MPRCDTDYRDYIITFRLGDEKQIWIGESRSLLHTHPEAVIINIKKTNRKK